MKRVIGFLGWTVLASGVLGAALVIAAISSPGAFDPTTIRIDGESLNLTGMDFGDWLVAAGGIGLALLIVAVVVPLAVLLPLAVAAVAIMGALLLVAGLLAMLFSPLLLGALAVWLMVRLIRGGNRTGRTEPARGSATITG